MDMNRTSRRRPEAAMFQRVIHVIMLETIATTAEAAMPIP